MHTGLTPLRGGTLAAHHLCIVQPSTYKAIPRDLQQLPLLTSPSEEEAALNYITRMWKLAYSAPVEPHPNETTMKIAGYGRIVRNLCDTFEKKKNQLL